MNIEHVPSLAVAIEENIVKSNMKRETFGMEDNIKKLNSFHEFQSKKLNLNLVNQKTLIIFLKVFCKDGIVGFCSQQLVSDRRERIKVYQKI